MPEGNTSFDEVKGLVVENAKAFEQFKETVDLKFAELKKKGAVDPILEEKIQKISDSMSTNEEKQQKALQKIEADVKAVETLAARPNPGNGNGVDPKQAEAEKKFFHLLRKGEGKGGLSSISFETKVTTGSVDSDADGGYAVPLTFNNRIVKRMFETQEMRSICTVMTTGGDDIDFTNDVVDIDSGWVAEQASRTQTKSIKTGRIRIATHEQYAAPKVTQKLLDDAFFPFEEYLANRVADKLNRDQNAAFVSGTGNGQPVGFLNYSAASVNTDDATRSWGVLQYTPVGATTNAAWLALTNPGDIVLTWVYKLKVAHLANARFLFSRDVLTAVRQLKNSVGGYLWQPSYQAAQPPELLGYPVMIASDMPTSGSGKFVGAFGDFREGYTILDRMGLRILRDPFTSKPNVIFYTTARVGGDVTNFDAIKLLKMSAT